jgi:hypothetical protein
MGCQPARCWRHLISSCISLAGRSSPFHIPNDRALLGLTVYQQWLVDVEERSPTGIDRHFLTSNGGAMTIGL